MKITLKNISEKSGVSIATVSRILSRKNLTHSANELKVINIAKELGYPYIRNISNNKKTINIALILRIEIGEFYPSLFNGFINSSINTNYQFSLVSLKKPDNNIDELINNINQYDGACIFLPNLKEEDYHKIKETIINKPIISLAPIPNPIINTVTFDSYRGGYLTAKFFFENGYNNVGLICGPTNRPEANYRKNGFIDFINLNSSMNLHWIYNGDYSTESGHEAYIDLKKTNINKITLFSCNDGMALGFIKEATRDGIKIPKDIRISGYDNLPICVNITPSLTSINTDYKKLGKQAIQTLDQIAEINHNTGNLSLIPVELIPRKSTDKA